jgi:mono/diheme cytochrome c family protein
MPSHHLKWTLTIGGALLTLAAYGLWAFTHYTLGYPYQWWLIDMMDSQSIKAYESTMGLVPEGAVSRNRYVPNADRLTPAGQALTNPYTVDDAFMASGEWGFATYCAPCHNPDGLGNGPVTQNDPAKGQNRFMMPGLALVGPAGISKSRSDGYLYLTIRNGGAIMPAYNWALEDPEIWAIVAYLRTLDGNAK